MLENLIQRRQLLLDRSFGLADNKKAQTEVWAEINLG